MQLPSRLFAILTLLVCFFAARYGAQAAVIHYSSGTGFFVSKQGLFITNAHVVRNCKNIHIAGASRSNAEIIAIDETHDLALLRSENVAPQIAPLRFDLRHMRVGQNVAIAGYPGASGFKGNLIFRNAQLLGFEGPVGEPHFLQFTPSAEKGNSGGPLLDYAGNVVGVVTGKTKLYEVNPTAPNAEPVLVREADIAVTLPYLRQFLAKHGVRPVIGGSGLVQVNPRYISQTASQFIVHVRCALNE